MATPWAGHEPAPMLGGRLAQIRTKAAKVGFGRSPRESGRTDEAWPGPRRGNATGVNLLSPPRRLGRYGDLARLLVKYGRSDLVRQAGLDPVLVEESVPAEAA